MPKATDEIIATDNRNYLPVFQRCKIVLDHGDGVYVYDKNGKKYIDFLGGIAVNVLGHNYAPLVKAVADQAGRMIHCSNLYYTEPQATAVARLVELSGLDRAFFANSGAEANEGAIKVARKYAHQIDPEKSEIITAWDSFHGRTLATLTATGQPKYQAGYEPLPGGFKYVHYNDPVELERMISDKTCAVMLETVQGEGGVYPPKEDYLAKVRELCDSCGALLILDEIQSGIGRTGKFFAYENYGVRPDIVTLAKGLAGGVPIGAFVVAEKAASVMRPGDHGTTFGGNPLACAAAGVVMGEVPQEEFLRRVKEVGDYFKKELEKLGAEHSDLVKEVRGIGLMLGMELVKPGRDIVDDCLERGAIINCTAGNVLRFVPPLIVTKAQVDEVIAILDDALSRNE